MVEDLKKVEVSSRITNDQNDRGESSRGGQGQVKAPVESINK